MEIKRLELPLQNKKTIKLYEKLTTEENHCYLHSCNPYKIPDLTYIALSAIVDAKPVGLLLATGVAGVHLAEVRSLYVTEKMRHKGIGTKLMIALEKELRAGNCIVVTMLYQADIANLKEFEQLLEKCKWIASSALIYRYYFKAAEFNPPWFLKCYQFPEGFTLFPFVNLTIQEKNELKRRQEQWNFPAIISPFLDEEHIEYSNSFGLKKNEEIIGWMIIHRLNESTIRYSSLYIEPKYQFQGFSIMLLIHSIKINQELIKRGHPAIWSVFDLNVDQTESSWQQFITRRLAPYAEKKIVINSTWKDLR